MRRAAPSLLLLCSLFLALIPAHAQEKSAAKPRARDLGVPFDGTRGDHVLLAPPFIITPHECQLIADALQYALGKVFPA